MDLGLEKRIKDKLNEIAEAILEVKATELRDKEVAFLVDHVRRLEADRCYEEAKIQWHKAELQEVSKP